MSYIYITLLLSMSLMRYLKSFHRGMSLGEDITLIIPGPAQDHSLKTCGNPEHASLTTILFEELGIRRQDP